MDLNSPITESVSLAADLVSGPARMQPAQNSPWLQPMSMDPQQQMMQPGPQHQMMQPTPQMMQSTYPMMQLNPWQHHNPYVHPNVQQMMAPMPQMYQHQPFLPMSPMYQNQPSWYQQQGQMLELSMAH